MLVNLAALDIASGTAGHARRVVGAARRHDDGEDDDQHAGRKTLAVILGRSGTVFFALVGGMVCLSGAALVRFALGDGYNGFAAITSAGFVAYAIVLLITRGKRLLLLTHFIALLLEVCYPLALALR